MTEYEDFRRQAASFLKKADTGTFNGEQLESGFKQLMITYVNTDDLTEQQTHEAVLLLEMCAVKVTDQQIKEKRGV